MTAVVPHKSYMTHHPSLFTLINHCVIAFSFTLMFTIVVGLLSAMASCSAQGRRQRGGQWCPAPQMKSVPPHFTFGPLVAAYIQHSTVEFA